jgi:hypothetical protein
MVRLLDFGHGAGVERDGGLAFCGFLLEEGLLVLSEFGFDCFGVVEFDCTVKQLHFLLPAHSEELLRLGLLRVHCNIAEEIVFGGFVKLFEVAELLVGVLDR